MPQARMAFTESGGIQEARPYSAILIYSKRLYLYLLFHVKHCRILASVFSTIALAAQRTPVLHGFEWRAKWINFFLYERVWQRLDRQG